ncbi:MAG: flagellar hook-basal body protein [Candidatus Hydrogenedentes bacterium]|nr:flagellar hook-basal body protein [Candidatus Hydrogenedentota bacterium]
MLQGLYTAATGMMAVEARQDIIANNITNAGTPGFKRHTPVQMGFYEVFVNQMRTPAFFNQDTAPGGGVKLLESFPNLAGGALVTTANPLNVGLQGPGFIAVATERGDRYTRNGEFTIDANGDLATATGYKVQGAGGGPIAVGGGLAEIAPDGSVTVNGAIAGQIRLVEFEQPARLLREGDNLFAASDAVRQGMTPATKTQVAPEQLEMSNVSIPQEMVNMMLGMRAYEANQRVIQAFDSTLERLIEQVGTPV